MYLINGFSLFLAEVRLLSAVKHKNLIGLVGYCEEPGKKFLVFSCALKNHCVCYFLQKNVALVTLVA
jgi:hypothetical protein